MLAGSEFAGSLRFVAAVWSTSVFAGSVEGAGRGMSVFAGFVEGVGRGGYRLLGCWLFILVLAVRGVSFFLVSRLGHRFVSSDWRRLSLLCSCVVVVSIQIRIGS